MPTDASLQSTILTRKSSVEPRFGSSTKPSAATPRMPPLTSIEARGSLTLAWMSKPLPTTPKPSPSTPNLPTRTTIGALVTLPLDSTNRPLPTMPKSLPLTPPPGCGTPNKNFSPHLPDLPLLKQTPLAARFRYYVCQCYNSPCFPKSRSGILLSGDAVFSFVSVLLGRKL